MNREILTRVRLSVNLGARESLPALVDPRSATSTVIELDGRYYHTAVWTGNEMIVWGGTPYPAVIPAPAAYIARNPVQRQRRRHVLADVDLRPDPVRLLAFAQLRAKG